MTYFIYIIYSSCIDRYYVGYSNELAREMESTGGKNCPSVNFI